MPKRPVRQQGVKHIRHCGNPGIFMDFTTGDAARITAAVETFVMLIRNMHCGSRQPTDFLAQPVKAQLRMLFHFCHFSRCKLVGFFQNILRNRHFTDIHQQSAQRQFVQPGRCILAFQTD